MRKILAAVVAALFMSISGLAGVVLADSPSSRAVLGDGVAEALSASPRGESLDLIVTLRDGADAGALLSRHSLTPRLQLKMLPIALASGSASEWMSLSREPGVMGLDLNDSYDYYLDTAVDATRVRELQNGSLVRVRGRNPNAKALEKTTLILEGEGAGIAVVDTGVDVTHPDLAERIVPGRNLRNIPWIVRIFGIEIPPSTWVPVSDSDLHNGHGTHVAGIALGDGRASDSRIRGVAPAARLYAYGVGAGISVINFLGAYDHILANPQEPGEPPIKVINNSFGATGNPGAAETVTIRALVASGITVVFAAGNDGNGGENADRTNRLCKIRDASNEPLKGVICVANYSDGEQGTSEGGIASSSSRGLLANPTSWADVAAPGSHIQAARAKTATIASSPAFATKYGTTQLPDYITISGTSMAAPHVAGVAALMYEAATRAEVEITPAEIESIMKSTAHGFSNYAPYPNPHAGAGLVDARTAVETIMDLTVTPMTESLRKYSNDFSGIVFSGTALTVNAGVAGSFANDVSDLEGFGKPFPSTDFITPGATQTRLRAFMTDIGGSSLATAHPGASVCATITYISSGLTPFSGCLTVNADRSFFDSSTFSYRAGIDGDVRVEFVFDVQGDGLEDPLTDATITVLYKAAL